MLPCERANPDGAGPFSYHALTYQLGMPEQACGFREPDGSPAHVTAHRFRHTLATKMSVAHSERMFAVGPSHHH